MGSKNLFELERESNYGESIIRVLLAEETTKFIRIRERFELRDVELEKVNCTFIEKIIGLINSPHMYFLKDSPPQINFVNLSGSQRKGQDLLVGATQKQTSEK